MPTRPGRSSGSPPVNRISLTPKRCTAIAISRPISSSVSSDSLGQPGQALFGHAVRTAQVALVRQRHPKIGRNAPKPVHQCGHVRTHEVLPLGHHPLTLAPRSDDGHPRTDHTWGPGRRSGAQRRSGGRQHGCAVRPAEHRGVHEQQVQLVQRDPGPPPVGQRRDLVVARRGSGPDAARPPNRASWARSVSRCPPCAAGSISHTRSAVHSRFPGHRSPCNPDGRSLGCPYRSMRFSTASRPAPRRRRRVRPDRRPFGGTATAVAARTTAASAVPGPLSCGSEPMYPGHGAPYPSAPAPVRRRQLPTEPLGRRRRSARPRPPTPGPAGPAAPRSTSGTGAPPPALASASQRSPAASASKNPAGTGSSSASDLANTDAPSASVSRRAWQIDPPPTGVSRIRWWVRNVGSCCGCARR